MSKLLPLIALLMCAWLVPHDFDFTRVQVVSYVAHALKAGRTLKDGEVWRIG